MPQRGLFVVEPRQLIAVLLQRFGHRVEVALEHPYLRSPCLRYACFQITGGEAYVQPAELTDPKQVQKVGEFISNTLGRLDILVNNAGVNIVDRHWDKLTPEGIDVLVNGNLSQALYCVTVALPLMRT